MATKAVNEESPDAGTGVSVTLKGGNDYAAPWVVVRAPDVAGARVLIDDEENLTALLDSAHKAGRYFAGLNGAATNTSTTTANAGGGGDAKKCQHGPMQWKSGFSAATGKAWQGWFCPSPKGTPDQCKPEFTRG